MLLLLITVYLISVYQQYSTCLSPNCTATSQPHCSAFIIQFSISNNNLKTLPTSKVGRTEIPHNAVAVRKAVITFSWPRISEKQFWVKWRRTAKCRPQKSLVVVTEWKTSSDGENWNPRDPSSVVALILISVAASLVASLFLLVTTFLICEHAKRKTWFIYEYWHLFQMEKSKLYLPDILLMVYAQLEKIAA